MGLFDVFRKRDIEPEVVKEQIVDDVLLKSYSKQNRAA